MPLITKPDFTYVWASGGAVVAPNDTKKQLGWIAEAPPFQYDNWLQNRQDQMLAHINQRGIPAWDGLTNYEAGGLSYVQGSDGKVYKSVAASGPASVVSNPTTDATDTYWTEAFSPIVSPAFSGNPTAPTAAQFDNDTSIATTEFVQRALGNMQGQVGYNTSQAITAEQVGKLITFDASSLTLTLPSTSTVPSGSVLTIYGNTSGGTIQKAAGDTLINGTFGPITSFNIAAQDKVTLVSIGFAGWYVIGGEVALKSSSSFSVSLGANGYQKLPSGLIIQWGQAASVAAGGNTLVTYPIAFPSAVRAVFSNNVYAGDSASVVAATGVAVGGLSQFTIRNHGASPQSNVSWFAIGN